MKLPFRTYHLIQLLEEYDAHSEKPLDYSIACYFRAHKALGSKDRVWIGDTVYALFRWKVLYDYLLGSEREISWLDRYELFSKSPPENYVNDVSLSVHIRVSFPKVLFDAIEASFGEEALSVCLALNERAPITIRANALKTSREQLLERFVSLRYAVSPCTVSPYGIRFHEKANFFSTPEFQAGLFEVQDEASQLVAEFIPIKAKDRVLDFCAGSGGKTLAFAYKLKNSGQIYLHDVREHVLQEAKRRLRRAGIQNAQVIHSDEREKLEKLKKTCDVILVDAPCSGTGTLRRNPDMKKKFTLEMLGELVEKQRFIFDQALSFLKPDGHIVYATCSILREENEKQMDYFVQKYNLEIVKDLLKTVPKKDGMDGFFAVCFRKSKQV